MTNQQFLDNFYLQLNKVRTLQGPGYDPIEISLFATEAQELLVNTKYDALSNILKSGFEETEKRIQDLGNLVIDKKLIPLATSTENMANGVFVNLPHTYPNDVFWYTVYEQAETNIQYCGANKIIKVYEINHNEYSQLLEDPFNKPDPYTVWRMRVSDNRHELITDGTYSIVKYHIRYIKKPLPIDLTTNLTAQVSELSDNVHRELVRKTVELVLDDTENRIRIAIENNKRKE
jgi:hypothetical protein